MILAYETATDLCSVAFRDKSGEVFEHRIQGRSVHSEHLFLFTQELMKSQRFSIADLDALLVSNGPGSYTGLRIAASTIKGLLFGLDVDLYACGTLPAFAVGAEGKGRVHSIMDARRTHLYHQSFEKTGSGIKALSQARVVDIADFEDQIESGDRIIGTGLKRLSEKVADRAVMLGSDSVSATNLIRLFEQQKEEYFVKTPSGELDPVYLSNHQVNNSKF